MECSIIGGNAKILAKAFQSYARIGNELYLNAQPDGLSIRTCNQPKSAYVQMLFKLNFFTTYKASDSSNSDDDTDMNEHNKCRISMKSCLNVFKNMKEVEECKMSLEPDRLTILLKCNMNVTKTHYISILDNDSMDVIVSPSNVSNKLTASYKIFTDIANHFQINEDELTIEASGQNIVVKNYSNESKVERGYMRSQLQIKPIEFDHYQIVSETTISFGLREMRAMLIFAEALNATITLDFEKTGIPVVMVITDSTTLEAKLFMSSKPSNYPNRSVNKSTTNVKTSKLIKRKRKVSNRKSNDSNQSQSKAAIEATSSSLHGTNQISVDLLRNQTVLSNRVPSIGPVNFQFTQSSSSTTNRPTTVPEPMESEELCVVFREESDDVFRLQSNDDDLIISNQNTNGKCAAADNTLGRRRKARTFFKKLFELPPPLNEDDDDIILAANSDLEN